MPVVATVRLDRSIAIDHKRREGSGWTTQRRHGDPEVSPNHHVGRASISWLYGHL